MALHAFRLADEQLQAALLWRRHGLLVAVDPGVESALTARKLPLVAGYGLAHVDHRAGDGLLLFNGEAIEIAAIPRHAAHDAITARPGARACRAAACRLCRDLGVLRGIIERRKAAKNGLVLL